MLYIPRLMVVLGRSRGHWDCARPSNSIDPMERLLPRSGSGSELLHTLEVAEAAMRQHRPTGGRVMSITLGITAGFVAFCLR